MCAFYENYAWTSKLDCIKINILINSSSSQSFEVPLYDKFTTACFVLLRHEENGMYK